MINRLFITDRQNNKRELTDYVDHGVGTKIEWTDGLDRREFEIENSKIFLTAISPTKREILVIHGGLNKTADTLKILNENGTIRFNLKPPIPITPTYLKFKDKVGDKDATASLRFVQFGDKVSETSISIWVGFDYDWFESRQLDLKTGEFGPSNLTGRL
ncbi:MAG: hypothetical protein WAZ98_08290 [Cyclobacteriaceae bacterium]